MSKYITADKVLYHPERITQWLKGEMVAPITIQFQISNICNQKCVYCIAEAQKDGFQIKTEDALTIIKKLSYINVKGITFTGGGEPTLHPDFDKIIEYTAQKKIEIGIETNGVLMDDHLIDTILRNVTWIRFSIDSIVDDTYFKDRGTMDLDRVLNNLQKFVVKKKQLYPKVIIGAQTVITKNNYHDIRKTAQKLKEIGLDYYHIRPFENAFYDKKLFLLIRNKIESIRKLLETDSYAIIISEKWKMVELFYNSKRRKYSQCLCYPFIGTINAHGDIYICCHMAHTNERTKFCYGNVINDPIEQIIINREKFAKNVDLNRCPLACSGTSINFVLYRFKNRNNHDNFL